LGFYRILSFGSEARLKGFFAASWSIQADASRQGFVGFFQPHSGAFGRIFGAFFPLIFEDFFARIYADLICLTRTDLRSSAVFFLQEKSAIP
jgi:hypothetical protein